MAARADALITPWLKSKAKKRRELLLHVHDWLGLFAGRTIKHRYQLPLLSTIHATEFGRNDGIRTDTQHYIHQCEVELQWESWRVIVCSAFMRGEVGHALGTAWDKMDIIYNGVDATKYDFPFSDAEKAAFRAQFAKPEEKIIYFIGRMVHEKGAQVLINAFGQLKAQDASVKLVIAGGGAREHLETQARHMGLWESIYFTGRISDEDRDRLYRVADAACYPSLYEPFGIVALEAMAAGLPVVVSNAGGLGEVVEHDHSGTVTFAGDSGSLAWGLSRALHDTGHAQWMAENAKTRCATVFHWDTLAAQTKAVYTQVWGEYLESTWSPA
jgi:glycosyltransferase involved in cell wall biosynthesis